MEQSLEPIFEQFYKHVHEQAPLLEPEFVFKVIQIQKSLYEITPTRSKPHVNLYIKYKDGVDFEKKVNEMRDKYPIQSAASKWGDGVIASGLMSIKNVQTVCSDPDIVEVIGKVNARHN